MRLNKELVEYAREVIEFKKPFWEKKLGIKFDKDGRALMGGLPSFDESDWREYILNNQSKKFSECFLIGLDELGLERFELKKLQFEDYKKKRVQVTTTKGRTKEVSLASLFQKAQNVWEREYVMYRPYRNHMKQVRAEDGGMEMDKLNNILRNLEKGNTYVAYDRLLREFREEDLFISINPLDKLFSSGGPYNYHGNSALTRFDSCWSNTVNKIGDEIYDIESYGSYANPEGQVAIGSHIGSGMVIIKNSNEIEVDGMKFYGMLQRSHVWLSDLGLFVENIYPSKYNRKLIQEVNNILSAKTKIYEPSEWIKLTFSVDDFNKEEWYKKFRNIIDNGRNMYFDRSGVNYKNGDIWINPNFRNGNFGGHTWVPSYVCGEA